MMPLLTVALAMAASLNIAGTQNGTGSPRPSLPYILGIVKEVAPDAVTLDVGGNAVTFAIDKATRVIQRGRKGSLPYRGPERPRTIRDFVKTGDRAQVSYLQFEDKLLAVELRVAPGK